MSPRLPGLGRVQMCYCAVFNRTCRLNSTGTALCGHFGIIFAITICPKKLLRPMPRRSLTTRHLFQSEPMLRGLNKPCRS